jgi:hypothetical protein
MGNWTARIAPTFLLLVATSFPAFTQEAIEEPEPATWPIWAGFAAGAVLVAGIAFLLRSRSKAPQAKSAPPPETRADPPPNPPSVAVSSGPLDYFVSHASENAAEAARLVSGLERAGLRCWIAPRNIKAGETYGDAIGGAVAKLTKATLVIVSAEAEASAGVKSELELARRYSRPIVPVMLGDHAPGKGMLYYIGTSHWLAFDNASDATIAALVDAVRD